jgi:hypothetical protein
VVYRHRKNIKSFVATLRDSGSATPEAAPA